MASCWSIDVARGSESYDRALEKLSWAIEDQVRKLDLETQKMSLKGWFEATGAVVATCTALLLALHQTTLASVASMAGGGGAWWLLREAMKDRLEPEGPERLAGFLHVVAVEVGAEALSASPGAADDISKNR